MTPNDIIPATPMPNAQPVASRSSVSTDAVGVEPVRRLYLDLDGVMADFDAHFPATFGLDHRGLADDAMWATINAHPSYFRDMPPCPGAVEFFRSIEHLRPIILTACPKSNYPHVARQKRAWVREHLSEHVTVLPVMGGRHKPLFMQEPGDILIDDWRKNIEAWDEAGGVGILHRSFDETAAALAALRSAPPQQEAVPVACFACEDHPKAPNIPCAVCGRHPSPATLADETLRAAARAVIKSASDTYRDGKGEIASLEGDDGEKSWIVPFEEFESLRHALDRPSPDETLRARIEAEARRYAGFYPEASDGRNTFVIFADWISALAQPSLEGQPGSGKWKIRGEVDQGLRLARSIFASIFSSTFIMLLSWVSTTAILESARRVLASSAITRVSFRRISRPALSAVVPMPAIQSPPLPV